MMMMMMMPQMPNPLGIRNENVGRAFTEVRTLGDLLFNDMSGLFEKYSRSLDLDKCPQRLACEFGAFVLPTNITQIPTAKTLTSYIVDQAVPKGKVRKMLKQVQKAFWLGSSGPEHCGLYHCKPSFHLHQDPSTLHTAVKDKNKGHGAEGNEVHIDGRHHSGQRKTVHVQHVEPQAVTVSFDSSKGYLSPVRQQTTEGEDSNPRQNYYYFSRRTTPIVKA